MISRRPPSSTILIGLQAVDTHLATAVESWRVVDGGGRRLIHVSQGVFLIFLSFVVEFTSRQQACSRVSIQNSLFLQVFQSWAVSVHCCVQSGNAHMTETPVKRESCVDSQTTERPKAAVVNRKLKKLTELNSYSVN